MKGKVKREYVVRAWRLDEHDNRTGEFLEVIGSNLKGVIREAYAQARSKKWRCYVNDHGISLVAIRDPSNRVSMGEENGDAGHC